MASKPDIREIGECLWEIPPTGDMRVPAQIVARDDLLPSLNRDRSLRQLCNVATLPGIRRAAMVMPDAHEGYGFPIGGVAATAFPGGCISPGGIGYDINCGVRLLRTPLTINQVERRLPELAEEMYRQIPSGLGKGGSFQLNTAQIDRVLKLGAEWAVAKDMGTDSDLACTESWGRLKDADPAEVSNKAKQRGRNQLGTIGSGNHFAEVDVVDEIFDTRTADAFGLAPDQVVVLIHTGSRGLGHQTATDYIRLMMNVMPNYDISLPDRELACVPFDSEEGQRYFKAMCAAANFAWCNRQLITWELRNVFRDVFGLNAGEVEVVYDVAHNIAKIETYRIDGVEEKLIVHRKGATRAFWPGHPDLPERFRETGQPVLIPGSMGTSSFVLAGQAGAGELTFGSCCHGAGRRLSRTAAKKQVEGSTLIGDLKDAGVHVRAGSFRGVAEEAPLAYKDVDVVVDSVSRAGLAKIVARLKPKAVIKG